MTTLLSLPQPANDNAPARSTPKEIAAALRIIYGDDRGSKGFAALLRFAQTPTEDHSRHLEALGLLTLVKNVLIDGVDLIEAGRAASNGRYSTDNQARAYAIAQIHVAGKALVWNETVFVPHRRMAAEIAERYRTLKAIRAVGVRKAA